MCIGIRKRSYISLLLLFYINESAPRQRTGGVATTEGWESCPEVSLVGTLSGHPDHLKIEADRQVEHIDLEERYDSSR